MKRLEVSGVVRPIYGSLGVKRLRKNFESLPGKHSIDSIQKTAILGTPHNIRKLLLCEA